MFVRTTEVNKQETRRNPSPEPIRASGVEFIHENSGGSGVRLRERQKMEILERHLDRFGAQRLGRPWISADRLRNSVTSPAAELIALRPDVMNGEYVGA
jgi:hypothetical protein